MRNGKNINSLAGNKRFDSSVKARRLKIVSLSFLMFLIVFFGLWQLWIKVVDPFKYPEENNALILDSSVTEQGDVDGDGLSDYDETFVYGTSPYLEDTDSDGILDNEELARGSDPNCPQGTDCSLTSGYYLQEDNSLQTENNLDTGDEQIGVDNGLGDVSLPDDVSQERLEQIMSGDIEVSELRAVLIESGMDAELLAQISDEDLLLSYQEVLNNSNEE